MGTAKTIFEEKASTYVLGITMVATVYFTIL